MCGQMISHPRDRMVVRRYELCRIECKGLTGRRVCKDVKWS